MNTKRLGIILFAIMLPFTILAKEENLAKEKNNVVKITSRGMNKLFAGIYNIVDISVAGVPQSDLKIGCTNATIQQIGKGSFRVKPIKVGQECVITVFGKDVNQNVGYQSFQTLALPLPEAYLDTDYKADSLTKTSDIPKANLDILNNAGGGKINKESLLAIKGITAKLATYMYDIFDTEPCFQVLEFNMKFLEKNGEVMVIHSASREITDQMRKKLKNVESGSTFYVTDIMVQSSDHLRRKLRPIEVIVK